MYRVLSKDGCNTTFWSPYFTLILHLPSLFRWSAGKSFYTTLPKIKVKMRKHFFSWTSSPPPSPPAMKIRTSNALYKWVESAEFSVQSFFDHIHTKKCWTFLLKITHNGIICEAASTAQCLKGCLLQKTADAAGALTTICNVSLLSFHVACLLSTQNAPKNTEKNKYDGKDFFLLFWLNTVATNFAASVWKDRQPTVSKHLRIFQDFQREM